MRKLVALLLTITVSSMAMAQTSSKRMIRPEDIYRMSSVSNPKLSPDGNWIMYQVSKADSAKDK